MSYFVDNHQFHILVPDSPQKYPRVYQSSYQFFMKIKVDHMS